MKALIDGRATLLFIEWHGPLNKRKKVLRNGEPLSWFSEYYSIQGQPSINFSYLDQPKMVFDIQSIQPTSKIEINQNPSIITLFGII